ncbi:hypothetical protein [Halosegnis marinus]|uniref:hypothetical protein n=1 Tax=Halosegnis marinus TaxID=3034023 RepID=UPI00361B4F51
MESRDPVRQRVERHATDREQVRAEQVGAVLGNRVHVEAVADGAERDRQPVALVAVFRREQRRVGVRCPETSGAARR